MNTRMRMLATLALWLLAAVGHAGTVTYVYTDPQGTPLAEANASGTITATYDYTPYGKAVSGMSGAPNGPGYTGHVNDPDTGLVYMQARYYDPAVGSFMSVDPVGVEVQNVYNFNNYAYADNNPISNIDPTGMYTCDGSESFCNKVDKLVATLDSAKNSSKLDARQRRTVQKIIDYVGSRGVGGPKYVSGSLDAPLVASTDMKGVTTLDSKRLDKMSDDLAASFMGHEAQHDLDVKNGILEKTDDRVQAEKQFWLTEKNAYGTQSIFLRVLNGTFLNSNEMNFGVKSSVTKDLKNWDQYHKQWDQIHGKK